MAIPKELIEGNLFLSAGVVIFQKVDAPGPHPLNLQGNGKEPENEMGWKEAYQEKADAQLQEWHTRIEQYKEEPITFRQGRVVDRRRCIVRLDETYRLARSRLDELKATGDPYWETAKEAVELAMIELKKALDESGAGQSGGELHVQAHRSVIYEPFNRKS